MLVPEDRRTTGTVPGQSVYHNILLSVWRRLTRLGFIDDRRGIRLADGLASVLRIGTGNLRVPIETLSGGNQQKALIGRALAVEPKLLMLDEPTAGIDVSARRDLMSMIRAYVLADRSVLLVSSDLQELGSVCDRILFIHRGRIVGSTENRPEEPLKELDLVRLMHAFMEQPFACERSDDVSADHHDVPAQ